MIYELNHFGIVVKDLKKSLDFYQGVMGGRVVYHGYIPPTKTDVVYILLTGGLIELLAPTDPGPDTVFGITHVAFMSNDLDADYARLVDLGYKGFVAPKTAGSGVGRLAFIGDPNGVRIELIQRDVPMRENPPKHPVLRSFDHYSLLANDLDGAMKLYRDVMGMKVLKEMTVPHATNPLSMVYLNWDYDVLELLHRPSPDPAAVLFGHYAMRVDNVDEALTFFNDKGVPTEPGFPKTAGTGIGRIGMIRDPDGVKIELVDRADLRDLKVKFSLFTGSCPEWHPADVVKHAAAQGWDGLEWRVADQAESDTPGFWAGNRANYRLTGLEDKAAEMADLPKTAGLALSGLAPYVPFSDHANAERVLKVAAQTGARRVRFTSPKPTDDVPFDTLWTKARADLEVLQDIAHPLGAQVVIQIHHGNIISTSSSARRLVDGLDPEVIAVMHDLGNTTIEGREGLLSLKMGLEILGPYLAHIHIKNAAWQQVGTDADGAAQWKWSWATLRKGQGDVKAYFKALKAVGYDGWVTLEEFTTELPLYERLADDLAFLKAAAAAA